MYYFVFLPILTYIVVMSVLISKELYLLWLENRILDLQVAERNEALKK